MVTTMADKLARLIACVERDISSDHSRPMLERAQTFTSDVIVAVALGDDWGGSDAHPTRQLLNRIVELSQEAALNLMLQLFGFQAPNEFRPSRFLDGSEDRLHHDKLLPFSRGHRDCIGKYFALLEAKLAVSALVSPYDLECVDPNEAIDAQLTTQPKGGARSDFGSASQGATNVIRGLDQSSSPRVCSA
jgi:Cytochrome P450